MYHLIMIMIMLSHRPGGISYDFLQQLILELSYTLHMEE